MQNQVHNLTEKNISEFTKEHTLYITDTKVLTTSEFPVTFLCQFESFNPETKRVKGKIIRSMVNESLYVRNAGLILDVKSDKVSLYGKAVDEERSRYHRLKPDGTFVKLNGKITSTSPVIEEHESYAIARFTRYHSATDQLMFGATVRSNGGILLSIDSATLKRSEFHEDVISSDRNIIEIKMTETQFGQLISTFNRGSGVPVTISRKQGRLVEDPPFYSKYEQFEDEFERNVHNATVDIQESIKNLTSHIESIKMSKANKEYLDKEIKNIQNLFKSKIPYMVKRFNEQLEESVGEAKTEISAFINQLVNQQENKLIQNEIKQKLIDNNL